MYPTDCEERKALARGDGSSICNDGASAFIDWSCQAWQARTKRRIERGVRLELGHEIGICKTSGGTQCWALGISEAIIWSCPDGHRGYLHRACAPAQLGVMRKQSGVALSGEPEIGCYLTWDVPGPEQLVTGSSA
jgi:hypothetical protein